MERDGEIVGIRSSNNGRCCSTHSSCGEHIRIDDLVRFKLCVVDIDGKLEEAIKVVRIRDGVESCTVGYLPRNVVESQKEKYVDKFGQIIELYGQSESTMKRRKSNRNLGMASFILLEAILEQT